MNWHRFLRSVYFLQNTHFSLDPAAPFSLLSRPTRKGRRAHAVALVLSAALGGSLPEKDHVPSPHLAAPHETTPPPPTAAPRPGTARRPLRGVGCYRVHHRHARERRDGDHPRRGREPLVHRVQHRPDR